MVLEQSQPNGSQDERPMRVLMTNLFVSSGSGSEAVVELLADGLRRAGHEPFLFAPVIGAQARRMRARGHRVADRLAYVRARPDVIHAQHATPALMAMAAFPRVPVVYASHSSIFEVEAPWPHPQIRHVTALDERGRDRCIGRGIDPARISLVPNAVDLARFRRRPPLPQAPRRALLVAKTQGHIDAVRAACARHGLELREVGVALGQVSATLEDDFQDADIVFASGRSALEAACAGCAVVAVDGAGCAGLLTTEVLAAWRGRNFGVAILDRPTDAAVLDHAIAAYDAADAARVTDRLRAEASAEAYVERHLELYRDAIADPPPDDPDALALATATWLEELLPTSADRPWRNVAIEIGHMHPSPQPPVALEAVPGLDQVHEIADALKRSIDTLPSRRLGRFARAAYRRLVPLRIRQKMWRWRCG